MSTNAMRLPSRCVVCQKPCSNEFKFKQGHAHMQCIPVDERPKPPRVIKRKEIKRHEDYLL